MSARRNGSLLVEFALGVGLWAFLLAGFVTLARLGLDRLRAQNVTRFAAEAHASGLVNPADIRAAVQAELPDADLDMGDFDETPAAHFYDLAYARVSLSRTAGPLPPFTVTETLVVHKRRNE